MKKIVVIMIVGIFLASTASAITINKSIVKDEDCECGNDVVYTTIRPDGSTCECVLIDGEHAVMKAFPPKTQEQLDMMLIDPEPTVAASDLPGSFNWKDFGGDWTTPAKDQESCGSCWAFGALGGMEAAINIAKGDPSFNVDLSEQYVLSCLPAAGSCNGGWMSEAIAYIHSTSSGSSGNGINGCPREACMPYTATDYVPCSDKCSDWDYYTTPPEDNNILFQVLDYGITSINPSSQSDWELLKSWVYIYGPIVVDIYASSGWSSFGWSHHSPTDVYYGSESGTTNHAQVLCGWVDTNPDGSEGYWILKNSWGTGFGYGGFLNVGYGCIRVGDRDVTWVTTTEWPQAQPPDPVYPIKYVYAGWNYDPECPKLGDEIEFQDQSNGPVAMWEWDFDGDGEWDVSGGSSAERRPEWTYYAEGEYAVTQKVWSSAGLTSELTKTVEVKEIWPPVAVSEPDYYGGKDNVVHFEGRYSYDVDGTIEAYAWDFNGDGVTDTTENHYEYIFPDQNGEYIATLTVTDNEGATDTAEIEVKIDKSMPPETTAFIGGIGTNDDEWFDGSVKVDLYATDWSGVMKLYYRVDGGDWNDVYCMGVLEYTYDHLTVSGHGIHTVEFYSTDNYGNTESINSVNVKIDKINPTLDFTLEGIKEDDIYI